MGIKSFVRILIYLPCEPPWQKVTRRYIVAFIKIGRIKNKVKILSRLVFSSILKAKYVKSGALAFYA